MTMMMVIVMMIMRMILMMMMVMVTMMLLLVVEYNDYWEFMLTGLESLHIICTYQLVVFVLIWFGWFSRLILFQWSISVLILQKWNVAFSFNFYSWLCFELRDFFQTLWQHFLVSSGQLFGLNFCSLFGGT